MCCFAAAEFQLRLRDRAESFGGRWPRRNAATSSGRFCCLGMVRADNSQIARRRVPYCSAAPKRLMSAGSQTTATTMAVSAMITPLTRGSQYEPRIGNNCQVTLIVV